MPISGTCMLYLALALAAFGLMSGLVVPKRSQLLRWTQIALFGTSLGSLAALTWLTAVGDTETAYAAQYAAPSDASIGYRIAAVWAGQAGGLLLWCVEMALISLCLHPRSQPRAGAVLFGVQAFMLGMVSLSNPFAPSYFGEQIGLNPMLMHPMMLIHPPMLFLGYALLAVPFAITIGALIDRDPVSWPQHVRPWVMIGWLALTAGNGFGASWAYKTFGWGGFWGWDPVENTSFVPWMLSAASIHALLMANRSSVWSRTAVLCIAGSFVSVLYGSFLARSGLLQNSSVHAYTEAEPLFLWVLGGLMSASILCASYLLYTRWGEWVSPAEESSPPTSLRLGTLSLILIAVIVLIGMSLPVARLRVSPSLYNATLFPFALGGMFLLMYQRVVKFSLWRSLVVAALSLCICVVTWYTVRYGLKAGGGITRIVPAVLAPALTVCCGVVTIRSLLRLFTKHKIWLSCASDIAHIGVAVFLMGAVISGYGTHSHYAYIPKDFEAMVDDKSATVLSISEPSPNAVRAHISFGDHLGTVEIERSEAFNIGLRKAWISRGILSDMYITPMRILKESAVVAGYDLPPGVMVQISNRPGMFLVWAGIICIGLGLLQALFHRRRMMPA